jgi:DNA-binding CsgD family transcriptional regulator
MTTPSVSAPTGRNAPRLTRAKATGDAATALTAREREIIGLLADGYGYREIAAQLYLAVDTVKTHGRHAYERLGALNAAHAVALAIRTGQIGGGS